VKLRADHVKEAVKVFGADDPAHPSVAYLRNRVKEFYVGGKVQAISAPIHHDYVALRCEEIFYAPSALVVVAYDLQFHPQS